MSAEEIFAKRLRQHRERRGWSQSTLADWMRTEGVDLHTTAISRMESGGRLIRLNVAIAAARALNVQLEELLQQVTCEICMDAPPRGFTCRACSADA
jgi:transcriptional regulator with XRE-family HTH domain